ncbi:DNA-binding protein [Pseudomonas sp. HR96]|uniref:helix-turn-helix transcriptional regulator n=1 Tax=Pseudomonas sp. HR96 TaxID=1027966 RepID=UPI002A76526D|nr:DNA-binding protein [Pseudomonas sp. HR96]WPP00854.1 DNA-binding protein [Pseudomonas sp. HR96]
MEYLFRLSYQLDPADCDVDVLLERLFEAGCDDALVGVGLPGRMGLKFQREAPSAEVAMLSALADVKAAMPGARLIEAAPDMVGLSDAAEFVGVSRQNMRKLMLAHSGDFPLPLHQGSTSVWHLDDIFQWLQQRGGYPLDPAVLEVARCARRANLARARAGLAGSADDPFEKWVG